MFINHNWIPNRGFPFQAPYGVLPSISIRTYGQACTADTLTAFPFYNYHRTKLRALMAYVAAGAALKSVRMGIYTDSSGYPGTLIAESGSLSAATSSTMLSYAPTATYLAPGLYWCTLVSDGTPTMYCSCAGSALTMSILGFNANTDTNRNAGITVAHVYGALPNPFTGGGTFAIAVPHCYPLVELVPETFGDPVESPWKSRVRQFAQGSIKSPLPDWRASKIYLSQVLGVTATDAGVALTSDTLYLQPFFLPNSITIASLSFRVSTLAGGTNGRIGLYSDSGGYPATLLGDSGNISTASTGVKTYAIAYAATGPAWYWLALVNSGTPSVYTYPNNRVYDCFLGYDSNTDVTNHGMLTVAHAFGALPNPCTAGAAAGSNRVPIMQIAT